MQVNKGNRHRQQTYAHNGGGWCGGCMKRVNLETYITIYKIDSQWEFAVWLGELKLGFCYNLEGSDGEGDGKEVQEGGHICIPVADSC